MRLLRPGVAEVLFRRDFRSFCGHLYIAEDDAFRGFFQASVLNGINLVAAAALLAAAADQHAAAAGDVAIQIIRIAALRQDEQAVNLELHLREIGVPGQHTGQICCAALHDDCQLAALLQPQLSVAAVPAQRGHALCGRARCKHLTVSRHRHGKGRAVLNGDALRVERRAPGALLQRYVD